MTTLQNDVVTQIDNLTQNLNQIEQTITSPNIIHIQHDKDNIIEVNDISLVNEKSLSEFELVLLILKNNDQMKLILNKFNLQLDNITLMNLKQILDYLSKKNPILNNTAPIEDMITSIKEVFADGRIDASDIPTLITLMTKILNLKLSDVKFNININVVSIIIKLIIHILVIQDIIKINTIDELAINKLIDSSLILLNTTIAISNVKCSCFPCFNKKN